MNNNKVKYRIRTLVFYKNDIIYEHLFEQVFYTISEAKKMVSWLKDYDYKNDLPGLEHFYIIEVVLNERV